jgi:hypothetical protein
MSNCLPAFSAFHTTTTTLPTPPIHLSRLYYYSYTSPPLNKTTIIAINTDIPNDNEIATSGRRFTCCIIITVVAGMVLCNTKETLKQKPPEFSGGFFLN